jgi:NAD(P)-dependent dehydrogenase (short-subunit alcohol dehydrogenase family)
MPPEIWQQSIGVNFTGVFWTIQAAVRHMKPNKNGRIIVTTSAASRGIHARVMAAYPAAKAGIMHLVRRAAIELAPDGIRVNAIAPGIFVTNIGGGHMHKPEARKMMEARVPLGFAAETSEIHGAAIFLASHAGRYVTGEEILVDGGLLLGHR